MLRAASVVLLVAPLVGADIAYANGTLGSLSGRRRLSRSCGASCPSGYYDATGGQCYQNACGNGCAGGLYTDGGCWCACQCNSGYPADLLASSGPCLESSPDPPATSDRFVHVDQVMYYEDARAHCRTNYHDLASIHSSTENAEVDALCPGRCWIGGSDAVREGTWTWSDGTKWDYENWSSGQPDNWMATNGEDVIEMYPDGTWNDNDDYSLRTFVCSISGTSATTAGTCFSDDFSSIDSGWISVEGDWSWSGGTVSYTDAYGDGGVLYMDADYDDGYLEATFGISSTGYGGLLFRIADMPSAANYYDDAGQMYYCYILINTYQVVRCGRTNNNWSELFEYNTDITRGEFHDLGINMEGSHFTVFLDGAEIGSFSDSTYSSGGIGLRVGYGRGIYNSISFKPPGCTMPTTTTGTGYIFQAGRCYPQSEASVINTGGSMLSSLSAAPPKECYDWCVVNYNENDNWDAGFITHYDIKTFMGLDLRVASRSWDGSYGPECMCKSPGWTD